MSALATEGLYICMYIATAIFGGCFSLYIAMRIIKKISEPTIYVNRYNILHILCMHFKNNGIFACCFVDAFLIIGINSIDVHLWWNECNKNFSSIIFFNYLP